MDLVADAPRRAIALHTPMEMAGRALTPTATPPLAPSTLAVMIEMQAYAADGHRAGPAPLERRGARPGWDVEGEIDQADDGEIRRGPADRRPGLPTASRGLTAACPSGSLRPVPAPTTPASVLGGNGVKHILEELEKRREDARVGGGERRIASQHAKGKLTARERIDLLLDEGSFEEFDMFVEHRATDFGMADQKIPGDGVVTGWGTINGRVVFVFSKDFTVFGGSLSGAHAEKIVKVQRQALKIGAPIIGLFDAGGARIQEGVDSLAGYADIFLREHPGLGRHPADQRDHGPLRRRRRLFAGDHRLHLHGEGHELHVRDRPRRGEDGHPRGRQPRGPGRLPRPRAEVRRRRRRLRERPGGADPGPPADRLPAAAPTARSRRSARASTSRTATSLSLDTLVPANPNKPYDMKELILKVVDEADFFEISPDFAKNIVCGFARMDGQPVGIVANQPQVLAGVLDIDASRKAARFVRFCDAFDIPIDHLRRRAGLHAGHQAGAGRPDQARRQAAVRLRRGHRAEDHR